MMAAKVRILSIIFTLPAWKYTPVLFAGKTKKADKPPFLFLRNCNLFYFLFFAFFRFGDGDMQDAILVVGSDGFAFHEPFR